jgi:hypothetical protein
MFKQSLKSMVTYDEFEDQWTFEFPKAWVARPNSLRPGVIISDYQVGFPSFGLSRSRWV